MGLFGFGKKKRKTTKMKFKAGFVRKSDAVAIGSYYKKKGKKVSIRKEKNDYALYLE
jgi:hypothetical protein